MGKRVVAVDASLAGTGYAYYNLDGEILTGRVDPKKLRDTERLQYIRDQMESVFEQRMFQTMMIEGYSMGSKGQVFNIGELGGVLKLLAYDHGMKVLCVPPQTLKKWVTGKGTGKKEQMLLATYKRWGMEFDNNDECDAYCLLKLSDAYYRRRRDASFNWGAISDG